MQRICATILSLMTLIAGALCAQPVDAPITAVPPADAPELTEATALAAVFGADLGWQRIEGFATELGTRHGRLSIVPGAQCPNTREPIHAFDIRLDGERIESLGCTANGDYYIVRLKNAFELGARDVVVLGANAGGSGSPPERLHLIVLDPSGAHVVERDPAFRSIDGTERVAAEGERLWFDLGYDDGMRKIAVYDGATLAVDHRPVAVLPVDGASCEAAHRALFDCVQRSRNRDLTGVALREFLDAPESMSNASRRPLRNLLERPDFRAEAYMQACRVAAETGESPDYETFAASVCAR